jgi:hypothetical protein
VPCSSYLKGVLCADRGLYDQHSACPAWAHDFDCENSAQPADKNPALLAYEYRKVFQPDECRLNPWDTKGFEKCDPATHQSQTPQFS